MALFCVAMWRDSFSLLRFPFLSYVLVFSCRCCSLFFFQFLFIIIIIIIKVYSLLLFLLFIMRNCNSFVIYCLIHFFFYNFFHYYNNYYHLHYDSFSHQHQLMVFHWSLSSSESPQVSRTFLSILAVLNNVVVWMVSTRPLISKSSCPFNNSSMTVSEAPITSGIIVTFMFDSFFSSLAWSGYLSFFSFSFNFILWSAGTAKSTIVKVLFVVVVYYKAWSSGRDQMIRSYVKKKNPLEFVSHSLGQMLVCAYTICSYGQI